MNGARVSAALLVLWALNANADLFSPGELSKPHAALEGIANCTKCHPEGGRLSQATCLECHQEVRSFIVKKKGLHGRISEADRACETCHAEHQGAATKLINWGPAGKAGFEHNRTGWSLKGKHSGVKCDVCHDPRRVEAPVVTKWLATHAGQSTYLGLGTACTNCHFDEHRGQLKEATCESCHRETGWKPAAGFNHDDTNFKLAGRHTKVACTKCHASTKDTALTAGAFPAPVSETFMKFAPLEFKQCTDCHKDPHENRFGQKCSSCHTVEGWRVIRNAAQERGFHDKTRFPLKGEHLDVPCTSCHGPAPGVPVKFKGLASAHCSDCHTDAHEGQLAKAADCATCHSVDGFTPPHFTLADHQKTKFALEGAHQVVACSGCHVKNSALLASVSDVTKRLQKQRRAVLFSTAVFDFTKPTDACVSCHQDVHDGQFEKEKKTCQTCHSTTSFHTLPNFDHDKSTRFALSGKHAKVACEKCHAPAARGEPVRYQPLDTACASCHADPHAGQFGAKTCERCHDTGDFKPLKNFVHAPPNTTFALDGLHEKVACDKCHQQVALKGVAKPIARFTDAPTTCEGCHADYHHGAFKGFTP